MCQDEELNGLAGVLMHGATVTRVAGDTVDAVRLTCVVLGFGIDSGQQERSAGCARFIVIGG